MGRAPVTGASGPAIGLRHPISGEGGRTGAQNKPPDVPLVSTRSGVIYRSWILLSRDMGCSRFLLSSECHQNRYY